MVLMLLLAAGNPFYPDFTRLDAVQELHLPLRFIEQATGNPLEGELWLMSDYYGGFTEHLVSPIAKGEASLDFIRQEQERFFVLGVQDRQCLDSYAPFGSFNRYVLVIKAHGEIYRSRTLKPPAATDIDPQTELCSWPEFSAGIRDALASFGHAEEQGGKWTVTVTGYTPRRFAFSTYTGEPLANHCFTADIFLFQSNHCGVEETLPLEFPIETGPDGSATLIAPAGPLSIWLGYTLAHRPINFAAMPVLDSGPHITGWETDSTLQGALDCPRNTYKITLKDTNAMPVGGLVLNGSVIAEQGCGGGSGGLGETDSKGEVSFEICPNLLRPLGFSLSGNDHPMDQDYLITEQQCLELYEDGSLTIVWDPAAKAL